ncbi:MAG: ABC transporter permease [Zetaproteobacteria bacterium]|nr:ABC transporter permease [Zetaproteobacteria bacterium]
MNLIRFAFNNLYRRPARTILTLSAISFGIAAIVALTAIAWGFEASWQKANDARGTDLIVTRLASQNSMPSPFSAEKVQHDLLMIPHVNQAVGLLSEMLSVSYDSPPLFVFGWELPSYLWQHLQLLEGRWPQTRDEQAVMIGALAKELLHKSIGDTIEIEGFSYPVIGVFQSSALVENGAILMSLTQMQHTVDKEGKVNVLNLQVDADLAVKEIEQIKKTINNTFKGFMAITSGELVSQNAIVRISKAMSNATILIASLVGALIVFNTMLMSISERTREIGLLLALGWHPRTIMKLIISESAILSLAGGMLGMILGIALTYGLEHLELMRGKIDAIVSPAFLLAVLGLSIILGVLGGLYPALKAARTQPSHALRQE